MSMQEPHTVHCIGIGGIGMSALARYFHYKGAQVSGYDATPTAMTDALQQEGIPVHFKDDPACLPDVLAEENKKNILIIRTPAVPDNSRELTWLRENGFTVRTRAQVLGHLTRDRFTVAVAGTHGKTTTSTLLAHLLRDSGMPCEAFLGGISVNYNSNLLVDEKAQVTIVEADEYGRSFLELAPDIGVITSVDADHLDIYGTTKALEDAFREFAGKLKPKGKLILREGVQTKLGLDGITYSIEENKGDYRAETVRVEEGKFVFDLRTSNEHVEMLSSVLPGRYNIENAVAALAVAMELGVDRGQFRRALASFRGIRRRFEYRVKSPDLVYIDDYAHHPVELRSCIEAVRELYPGRKLTGIFQPHLFSRTRDQLDGLARSLEGLDDLLLLEIYPAREAPIEGVDSNLLLEKIKLKNKKLLKRGQVVEELEERELEVVLTLGAGNIDQLVDPLTKMLLKRLKNKENSLDR